MVSAIIHKLAIVVLGAPNDAEGNLSSIALERCEQALAEWKRRPDAFLLPTGGRGEHFNTTPLPHGEYIRRFLLARGVPAERILECAESANTPEDAAFARVIVERHGITELCVVTSDFHLPRARHLFERAFPDRRLSFVAAETRLPAEELQARQEHERQALARLRAANTANDAPASAP